MERSLCRDNANKTQKAKKTCTKDVWWNEETFLISLQSGSGSHFSDELNVLCLSEAHDILVSHTIETLSFPGLFVNP